MTSPSRKPWILVLLVALFLPLAGLAQAVQTATLTGTVSDSEGAALPGVSVTVSSPSLQGTRVAFSGVNGDFILRGLPAGAYEIDFFLDGMAKVESSTTLEVGKSTRVDAQMQVAAVSEVIEVSARAANALETTQISLNVTGDEIDALAVPRDLDGIADLAPGLTTNTANTDQITINGGFGYDNKWLVNGVEINDTIFGSFDDLFIEDAVEETQVLTSGISAEYGRFGGGVVNVITRSGGNQLEGSLRLDRTNPSWRDETPFEDASGIERTDETNEVWQGTLGGSVVRDKLWYFLAGRTQELERSDVLSVSGAGFNRVDGNDRFEVKLTGSLASSHTLTGSYINNESENLRSRSVGITIDPNALQDTLLDNELVVGRYAGVLTKNLFAEAQVSAKEWVSTTGGVPGDLATSSPFISFGIVTPQPVSQYSAPYFDRSDPEERNNEQLAGNLSYFLSSPKFGSHDVKLGFERFTDTSIGGNSQSPTNQIFLVDYLQDASGAPLLDGQGRFIPNFVPFGAFRNEWLPERRSELDIVTDSVYINDRWLLNDNWSFNIGFRYEEADSEATGDITAVDTQRFVPRLGASYDVRGDGKYKVDVTWAQYASGNNVNNAQNNSNVGNPSLVQYIYVGPAGQGLDFAPGFDLENNWVPVFARFPRASVLVDDLEAPITDEFTLSFGLALSRGGYLKATYVDRDTDDLVEDFFLIENGITIITDPVLVLADNAVFRNTNLADRKYRAVQLSGSYRLTPRWTIAGNYTYQIENDGNYGGEAGNQPVLTTAIGNQPEFFNGRNAAYGRLAGFQEHKVRLWSNYDLDLGRFGGLGLGLLYSYDSGTAYSLVDTNAPITATQRAQDPGYANPPTTQTIFFGERGSQTFSGFSTVDLAVNYNLPLFRSFAPWLKLEVRNLFNDDTLISHNTTVSGDFNGPTDELGLPLNFVRGPRFGQGESNAAYVTPREYRYSLGFRF